MKFQQKLLVTRQQARSSRMSSAAIVRCITSSSRRARNLTIYQRCTACAPSCTQGCTISAYDGEATMWCYERLKKSRAKRRVMFVVTDGDPSGTYISKRGDDISYFTARHFRDVVAFIEAEKNVEIIGVPIKADVSRIFGRSVRIDSIEDIYKKLSPFILALLRELNEYKRPSADTPNRHRGIGAYRP